jgi:hypothetical protein
MEKKAKKRSKHSTHPKRKRVIRAGGAKNEKPEAIRILSYTITDGPFSDPSIAKEVQDEIQELYDKTQRTPKRSIGRLEELIAKYPNVPILYNYISVAYSNLNDKKTARYYIRQNYRHNPDYLFAKLNYAGMCIDDGNFEMVPEILDNKFDIKLLYPERDVFHISEVIGFNGIAGLYCAHAGMKEQAEIYCETIDKLDPGHPYISRIKRFLFDISLDEGIDKIIEKIKGTAGSDRQLQ